MSNKTILITGCSTGFGRALVSRLLERNHIVIATLRNAKARPNIFSQELEKYPGLLHVLSLDVTNEKERQETFEFVKTRLGQLDVLINNAGYGLFGALEDVSESQLRQQMEVNYFGLVFLTRQLLPLLRQARGRILNISSVAGTFGIPLASPYCSSKFAVEGLSESLYYELKPFGVQVCLVEPGRHRTNFSRNMAWGEKSSNPASPYSRQTENYLRRQEKLGERSVIPQENVVKIIAGLCEAPSIPLRVAVGKDARLVNLLKTLLPQRLRTALFSAIWKKALG